MKQSITVGGHKVIITDKGYLAAGGEAAVYKSTNGLLVYKLYHDPKKASVILNKIAELKAIQCPDVLVPQDVVYDTASGDPIGYSMEFLPDTDPLCKYFTKSFKIAQKITPSEVKDLVTHLQKILPKIHSARCLVVDLNELNVLVEKNRVSTHVIDTDSFQTPTYPATAIMPSVRDPKATKFSELSDWYSWGILAFQAYINVHPFKGNHPDYSAMDWQLRMRNNVSVFDKKATLPPVCNPFSVIPKNHLAWFEAVFQKGERSVPPLADAVALPVPQAIQIVKSSGKFLVDLVHTYDSKIQFHLSYQGLNWVATQTEIYRGTKSTGFKLGTKDKVRLLPTQDGDMVVVKNSGTTWAFHDMSGNTFGSTTSVGGRTFAKNNALYTIAGTKLVETSFFKLGTKIIPKTKELDNLSEISTVMFDGVIIQDLLGEFFITVPYDLGKSKTVKLPELKGHRVLEARSERNVVVVLSEKGGDYWRHVVTFDDAWKTYTFRLTKVQQYDSINFTIKPNGVGVLVSNIDEVEVFKHDKVATYNQPPFDASMWLFNHNDNVYFISDSQIFQTKIV